MSPGQLPSSSYPAVESSRYCIRDLLLSACQFISRTCNTSCPSKEYTHVVDSYTHTHTQTKHRNRNMDSMTLYMPTWETLFTHTHMITHSKILWVIIYHTERNLQSCSLPWRLGLKAFLWKFMPKQLWSHPPLYGPKRQRCPGNYEGDPIHYTPPVNSQHAYMHV